MAVLRVVALDEFGEMLEAQRLLFQRVVNVGAIVVIPDLLCPRVFAGLVVVEEDHVGFHALCVKNAGRQAQDRMKFGGLEQVLPDGLTRATLKQHVIGHHDGGAARGLEHGADVLNEIELLVGGRRPEVLPVIGQVVRLFLAFIVGEAHGAFFAERRIGEDIIEALRWTAHKRVVRRDQHVAVDLADVMQEHIHQAQAARVGDDFVAVEGLVL